MNKKLFLAITACVVLSACTAIRTVDQNGQTNTVVSVSSTASNVVNTIGVVVPFVPAPWGTIAGTVLTFVLPFLGYLAKVKQDQLNTKDSLITAMIKGVESYASATTQQPNAAVKQAIQASAINSGVEGVLAPIVAKVTSPQG